MKKKSHNKEKHNNELNIKQNNILHDKNFGKNINLKKIKIDFEFQTQYGFDNIGNTCYMNSFLQILFHTPNFLIELKKIKKKAIRNL